MSSRLITRRKFFALSAGGAAAAVAADSVIWEPNRPVLVRKEIALARWPDRLNGFTIAMLSDFHYDPIFSVHPLHAAVPIVNDLNPDLIVLTGDFVSVPLLRRNYEKAAAEADPCAAVLKNLRSKHGLWAVLGNHDDGTDPERVTNALQENGITVLANQSSAIEQDGARFWLSGVKDVLSWTADLPTTLRGVPSGEATVLMAHEPDFADQTARYPVDLQLSGHSHGGQIRFPVVGPLYLPALAKKYVWGQYRVGNLTLYTNAGLGTVQVPARLNCPPEITLFTVRRAAA